MTTKTHIAIAAYPDLKLNLKIQPVEFKIGGEASFALATGDIHIRFDEIPVTVAIPFLRRRVVAGTVGPFGIHVKPFEAQIRAFGLDTHGVLGRDDIDVNLHGTGNCKAEIEVSGRIPEKILTGVIKTIVEE